jgi:hypothetical protein
MGDQQVGARSTHEHRRPAEVEQVKWDPDRESAWRVRFEKAKSEIEVVNAKMRRRFLESSDDVKRDMVGRTEREVDQAIQAAGYAATRTEVIDHLRGQVPIWNGPVEFYSAYQSSTDFEQLNPEEDAIKHDVERVNFLIMHRLAIPDAPPALMLDRAVKLAVDPNFRKRRRLLYDYQTNMLGQGYKPEHILKELDTLVSEYNEFVLADNDKCRWETVFTVAAVVGAALTAWAGFNPPPFAGHVGLAGAAASVAPVVWTKLQPRKAIDEIPKIAAGEAMFHQMEGITGFQFRPIR